MAETTAGRSKDAHPERRQWLSVAAWCTYDWANSAFSTVINTFIFSVYFAQAVAADPGAYDCTVSARSVSGRVDVVSR